MDAFESTRWSVVLAAGGVGSQAAAAFEELCKTYWLPVYGYVRSRIGNTDDAYDLTQEFFTKLLEKKTISVADPTKGRFRSFLLTTLKNFLATQHQRQTALKRGGGHVFLSLDRELAESRLQGLHSTTQSPEQEFERRWALALLDQVLERLKNEQINAGREKEFAVLLPLLIGQSDAAITSSDINTRQATPEAIRSAVYRLRKRYRAILRDEIAKTIGAADSVDEELQQLIAIINS